MNADLPPPARAAGLGEIERITHRRSWRLVHVGFDMLYVAVLVLLAVVSVNVAAASLLGFESVLVEPLRLFASDVPTVATVFSGVVTLAWLALVIGALLLGLAPGHLNLKIYASLAAVFLILGALVAGWIALIGFGLLVLYMHGLGRAWYYETLRHHGVVLLVALGLLALTFHFLATPIPAGFAFGDIVRPVHHELYMGALLSLVTGLLPWWIWGLWLMHTLHLGRRVTAVIQQPKLEEKVPESSPTLGNDTAPARE